MKAALSILLVAAGLGLLRFAWWLAFADHSRIRRLYPTRRALFLGRRGTLYYNRRRRRIEFR